jgi:hypothetical protein
VHLVSFSIKQFVMMHGHTNVKDATRHSVLTLQPISSAVLYFVQNWRLYLIPLQSMYLLYDLSKVYLAVILKYFISSAVILLVSLAVMAQFSLAYNRAERARVLCSFVPVFFKVSCGCTISAQKT